jgi:hypothetical protein
MREFLIGGNPSGHEYVITCLGASSVIRLFPHRLEVYMADPKDREAYEEGREIYDSNFVEGLAKSISSMSPLSRSRTESEESAYMKGRRGEDFDEDKKD